MVVLKVIDADSSILLLIKSNLKISINPIPNQIHKNKIAVNILSV